MSYNHQRSPHFYKANYDSRPQPLRIHGSQVNVRSLVQYFNERAFQRTPVKPRQLRDPISADKVKSLVTNFNRLDTFAGYSIPATVASHSTSGESRLPKKVTAGSRPERSREVVRQKYGERLRVPSDAISGNFEEVTVSGGDRRETTYRRESPLRSLRVWKDETLVTAKRYAGRTEIDGSSPLQQERDIVARRRPGHKKRRIYGRKSREQNSGSSSQAVSPSRLRQTSELQIPTSAPDPPNLDLSKPTITDSKPRVSVDEQILSQVHEARAKFRKLDEENLKEAARLGYPVPPQIKSTIAIRGKANSSAPKETAPDAPSPHHYPLRPYSRTSGDTLHSIFGGRSFRNNAGNYTPSNRSPLGPSPEHPANRQEQLSIGSPVRRKGRSGWTQSQAGWSRSQLEHHSSDPAISSEDHIPGEFPRSSDTHQIDGPTIRQEIGRLMRDVSVATRSESIYTPKLSANTSSGERARTSSPLNCGETRPRTFKELANQRRQNRLGAETIMLPNEGISVPPLRVVKNSPDDERINTRIEELQPSESFPPVTSQRIQYEFQLPEGKRSFVDDTHVTMSFAKAGGDGSGSKMVADKIPPRNTQIRALDSASSSEFSDRPVPMRSPSLMREIAFPNLSIRGARCHAHKSNAGDKGRGVRPHATEGTYSPRMKVNPDNYWKRTFERQQIVGGVDGSKDVSLASIHEDAPLKCASLHNTPDSSDVSGAVTAVQSQTSLRQLQDSERGFEGQKCKSSPHSASRTAPRRQGSQVGFSKDTHNFPAVEYKPEQTVLVKKQGAMLDGAGGMKAETSRPKGKKRRNEVDSIVKKRIKEFEEQRWIEEHWQARRKEHGLYGMQGRGGVAVQSLKERQLDTGG